MEKTTNCWSLYRHTSPSGKVYIGITSRDPEIRWKGGRNYVSCKKFYVAIKKYGWHNIKHEVLFTGLEELTAKSFEIDLIRHYKSLGISYNITDGGDGFLGYKPSEETRKKLSEASRRRSSYKMTEEHKNNLRKTRLEKYSANSIYQSKEFRNKISKVVEWKKVKVTQLTLDGEPLAEYLSANAAQKVTGIDRAAILRCCKGKNKTAGNFKWRFTDGNNNNYTQIGR